MKRFFCLLMSLMCLCLSAAHATGVDAEDYTVAGKLVKQLWAGSGFSATVSVEIAAREGTQAMSTLKPIVMDLSYIYVRPTATETAEHRADVVLLDGNPLHMDDREVNVVKGDCRCASIAAASIVAKADRDALMCRLAKEYPAYGFEAHKGYASPEHIEAIRRHGLTPVHRVTFCTSFMQATLF